MENWKRLKAKQVYQVSDLVKQLVKFLAALESDVTFAEKSSCLATDLVLVDSHHHHESNLVDEHHSQQVIFIHLKTLLLRFTKRLVPVTTTHTSTTSTFHSQHA